MTTTLTPTSPTGTVDARPNRQRWERPALAALLLGTLIAYLINLSANGWANDFYAAAVQAGSQSWEAFFFGSSDAANSITVDKPPASLWVMELSVRLFGLNSWSMLVPQVLLGVASVALLWATVRRSFGPAAGLIAGTVLAVTPVAVLMFRFNNPDALLVLLMIAAAWAMTRAVADGRWRWLLLTGAFIGFGFLAKQLQVLLVVPPLALMYLIAGPPKLGKRIAQLCAAGAAMVAGAGWWISAVELWPSDSRPWIGGSQHNSIIELTLGYNGLGRLNGNETGSVGPGGELPAGGNGMWGSTGITRMFEPAQGGQIAWLIPAALVALVIGLALRGRAPRTDPRRAALILWGGWLLVTGLVFSFMAGIFHQYYTVALAPAVAALVGIGAVQIWGSRDRLWVRCAGAVAIALTTATAWMLLSRSASFQPWLRWAILVAGVIATVAFVFPLARKQSVIVALAAAFIGLAGPIAYSVDTLASAHSGAIPSAGPSSGGMRGLGGPGMRPGGDGGWPGADGSATTGARNGAPSAGGTPPDGAQTGIPSDGATPGAQAGMPSDGGVPSQNGAAAGGSAQGANGGEQRMGGAGGLLGGSRPSDQIVTLLESNGSDYTWVAAAVGSNSAAGYQLATELPVMPIGGFNGSDPSPTLEQFQQYVADGKIHYFVAGGRGGPGGNSESTSSAITAWVTANYSATTVDGVTLYDLTQPKS
ncbi:glycosyltransferase family 39 protein [Nocardia fluminea]|uniref:4-amino-4-deoxy-L-arabinose transferase-like glycosyltransferase n=1 Tax=Nocardia fluminea TaxID=134984 RepID=A0A2N3VBR3_9NOCA|nr:glycosyltransferase family 39 protein [Nocardia fluminea]PKV79057.1 4-amino-4-deoxy-L-arabinose transferase-like glycosyltransferase [Nocardia fluminea]